MVLRPIGGWARSSVPVRRPDGNEARRSPPMSIVEREPGPRPRWAEVAARHNARPSSPHGLTRSRRCSHRRGFHLDLILGAAAWLQ
jgi:hypothetical protein